MSSTTQNTTGHRTFFATAAAIAPWIRVKVDSNGQISAAAASDPWIGVTEEQVAASGAGTVNLVSTRGTILMTASGAITRGAQVFPAASGKNSASGTTALDMIALEAATADGDVIECARIQKGA